jgi:hypothetical protein
MAENHCRIRIEEGATWNELLDAVKRYAAFVKAGGVSDTGKILSPVTFFSAADKPWLNPWEPPKPLARPVNGKQQQAIAEKQERERQQILDLAQMFKIEQAENEPWERFEARVAERNQRRIAALGANP